MAPKKNGKNVSSSTSGKTAKSKLGSSTALNSQAPRPLFPLSRPPVFNLGSSVVGLSADGGKGKGKDRAKDLGILTNSPDNEEGDSRLWVDEYEPSTEEGLAVHKRKVEDVRRWLLEAFDGGSSGKLRKFRRVLALTGPAGSAKTTTLRVLAQEMGAEIVEWKNSVDDGFMGVGEDYGRESLMQKFNTFLQRAVSCRPLLLDVAQQPLVPLSATASSSSRSQTPALPPSRRRIVLLEDLPNILHLPTQEAFHAALEAYVATPPGQVGTPLVVIISDAGVRAEGREGGRNRFGYGGGKEAIDVRTAIPKRLLGGPYVTQISFNPIAPTLMIRALQGIISKHISSHSSIAKVSKDKSAYKELSPTKEELEMIVESSNGDIRSAVMALQFACVMGRSSSEDGSKGRGKKKGNNSRAMIEFVTQRENSLALFHLLGKVLYNKRKGDLPGQSATVRDKKRESDLDARLKDPPPLPEWLKSHERKPSRVDADALYADSPIDASLFGLYLHQNYAQFCNEVDECGELCEWLSWVDSSSGSGENWFHANPHQFHLLSLGTLHSLPVPVARKGQKMCKPEFFETGRKMRDAEEAVENVRTWLKKGESASVGDWARTEDDTDETRSGSNWIRDEVVTELGAVLRLKGQTSRCPPHQLFTSLVFKSTETGNEEMLEDGEFDPGEDAENALAQKEEREHWKSRHVENSDDEGAGGGWLVEDDIEDGDI